MCVPKVPFNTWTIKSIICIGPEIFIFKGTQFIDVLMIQDLVSLRKTGKDTFRISTFNK